MSIPRQSTSEILLSNVTKESASRIIICNAPCKRALPFSVANSICSNASLSTFLSVGDFASVITLAAASSSAFASLVNVLQAPFLLARVIYLRSNARVRRGGIRALATNSLAKLSTAAGGSRCSAR